MREPGQLTALLARPWVIAALIAGAFLFPFVAFGGDDDPFSSSGTVTNPPATTPVAVPGDVRVTDLRPAEPLPRMRRDAAATPPAAATTSPPAPPTTTETPAEPGGAGSVDDANG